MPCVWRTLDLLDLSRVPYVLYGVEYIDLVTLAWEDDCPFKGHHACVAIPKSMSPIRALTDDSPYLTWVVRPMFCMAMGWVEAAGMGALVIRAHTVGVSTGGTLSFEPKLGAFAEGPGKASDHIDYAIYRASQTGIRLIVPLTDNYAYFHGGKHDFVDWVDPEMKHRENCVLPLCVQEPEAALCPFYTDRRIIDAFKTYVKRLLTHVNQYTGRALKDEPAIMGWETGNELNGVPANWTLEIADFIKGELEAKQLVFDGIDSERLGGVAKLARAEIEAKSVDCYTDHFYPPNPAMVVRWYGVV